MHKIIFLLLSIIGSTFLSIDSAMALEDKNSVGELEITDSNQKRQFALLMDTDISGSINGMIASITIRQSFKNQTDGWVNGRYVFPLSEGAAVDSLKIQIGERIIDGIVKEKEVAKKTFEQAKQQGKKAGLLEQHRPNLFSISMANIAPHEEIIATITFIDRVRFNNNEFSLRLPTTLTPRYIPGAPIKLTKELEETIKQQLSEQRDVQIEANHGWATNTTSVSDANDITPPHLNTSGLLSRSGPLSRSGLSSRLGLLRNIIDQTTHHFSLNLSLNPGLVLKTIHSDTHSISSAEINQQQTQITLSNGKEALDRDLVLSWQNTAGNTPKAAHFQQEFEGAYYSMLMLNPPKVDATLSLPRDVTFIIDSSGSMAGTSIAQAKQALLQGLDYLSSSDVFNIIDFDSRFTTLFKQSHPVNARSLRQARNMVNHLDADGGTEMIGALQYALRNNNNETFLKQIVFITDGAIGNESELFELINSELGDSRLFTIGIGSAPNSYFMNRAAKFGRGSYTYISNLNQISEKIDSLFQKITHPQLRDVDIKWDQVVEQFPERIPDLYAGEPVLVMVKSDTPLKNVEFTGALLQTPWQQTLTLGNSDQSNAENLDAVWAREKVATLTDKLLTKEVSEGIAKPHIVELGIKHNIVTKFTSLVAVDNTPVKPQHVLAKNQNVPNLMPNGSSMAIPQTATPATLLSLLGGLLILVASVLKRLLNVSISRTALNVAAKQS